uniref:Protein MRVI1 n=2 Tax=Lygus hesperus TaxID=30085 RepID=A0A146MET5_LYGHE
MGNCLSGCTARSTSGNGGETVISYAGGKFYQTTKEQAPCLDAKAQTSRLRARKIYSTCFTISSESTSSGEKQVKEYAIVQKELEALQSQISHSQAVLASLKFTFLEASAIRKNLDKVNRTTQTFQDSQPKSLENVSASGVRDKGWQQLTSSCPAIVHNIAVQTEFVDLSKPTIISDAEYFLPPIGSPLDLKNLKDPRLGAPVDAPNSIDLDIYRSCRKLSVLPEEEATGDESPPGSRLAIARYPEQQSHSFESYLLPASIPQVIRQLSDPTTSRSTRRPLQVSTSVDAGSTEGRVGVQDSGLGSETRIPSPTFTTLQDTLTQLVTISYSSDPDLASVITLRTPVPMSPEAPFKTPPDITPSSPNQNSSSDTSLSFQTPTEITPGNESPVERLPFDRPSTSLAIPEKPMLSVLLDDKPLPPPPPQALDAPNEGPLRRVPSKRGKVPLIRSMARTDSKTALVVPSGEDSASANGTSSANGNVAENGPCSSQSQTSITVSAPILHSSSESPAATTDGPINLESNRTQGVTVDPPSNDDNNGLEMERQENQAVFPSLSDAALRQLGLWLQANSGDEREPQLTDGDVENKYTSLVLAFKTDKLTLTRRLELQNKLRDQAEINMTHEFDALKSVIQLLSTVCIDAEKAEMFEKIRQQVETLYKATLRVSSTAEMYGAVQQENRLSKAVDIVLRHVDNLKQAYDKEKTEHEETKKLAQKETKPVSPAVSALKNLHDKRYSVV